MGRKGTEETERRGEGRSGEVREEGGTRLKKKNKRGPLFENIPQRSILCPTVEFTLKVYLFLLKKKNHIHGT